MIIKIAGATVDYQQGSIDIDDAIGARSTASFSIIDRDGTQSYSKGEQVGIFNQLPSYDSITANYVGKIAGSVIENGNIMKYASSATLSAPSAFATEGTQAHYDSSEALDGSLFNAATTTSGAMRQVLYRFDIIRALTDKYGSAVWQGKTALSDKIALAKTYISGWTANWYGWGSSPTGNKAYFAVYSSVWGTTKSHTNGTVTKLSIPSTSTTFIDAYGYINLIAYADPSDGVTASYVRTDYIELIIGLNPDATLDKVFGGVIDKPVSKYLSVSSNAKVHNIQCVDNLFITDKRNIAKVYTNMLAGDIVKDILTNYLSIEGITTGVIQDGPTVTEAVFNYISVTRVLERLAEIAGFEFNVDKDKKLQFFHRATNYNSTVITETSDIKNVSVEPVAEDYRNKQYIKAGMDTTDPQTRTFKGDGTTKTFTLDYPMAKVPTISVNGSAKTVGIKGVDSGKDFYWNKGENIISQDDAGSPLTSSQTLSVTYQGLFNIVAVSYDDTEISRMKNLDGTSGIYEEVTDDMYITSREAAFDDAASKLARYAKVGRRITFDTKITGLMSGQLIRMNLASYSIDDFYLIESSKATELGTNDGRMIYSVSVVDGSATGGWANFFKQLANKGEAFVLRENIQENEILSTLQTFSKTWTQAEQPNIFAKIYPGSAIMPGSSLYPSFEDADRVKYLVFYNSSSVELFRKPITKQTTTSTSIVSTTYIAPYEANNIAIGSVGWIGGATANANAGTGLIVDKQTFIKTKTTLESLQIDKTDTKGW